MRKPTVSNRLLTLQELDDVQRNPSRAYSAGEAIPADHPTLQFTRHAMIGLATTQPKKFTEMILPLENQNKNIKVINAIEWLRWWLSADEVSGSYLGNAYEKAQSLMDRIYGHIGYEKFMTQMKERGINPDNFAFIVNDTGSSMSANYSDEPEFARSRHEVSPDTSWPGVETGPILDAQGGVAAFHSSLKKLKARYKKEGREGDYNDKGWDEVTYLVFRPEPRREDIQVLSFEARIPLRYHTQPGRTAGDVLTSHDFLSLDAADVPDALKGKRIAEFREEYFRSQSPMALAMREMIAHFNVPYKFSPAFNRAAPKTQPIVVATQGNLIPAQNGLHKPVLGGGAVYQTTQYDHAENGVIDNMSHHADGVVLTPHSDAVLENWDHHFLDMMDVWCSLIVNKQVCVEQLFGKPIIVMNDKKPFSYKEAFNGDIDWDDPKVERAFVEFMGDIDPKQDPWLQFVMLTRYLHEKNFVKQEPHFLFSQMSPSSADVSDDIRALMMDGRKERIPVPRYESETFGRDRTDMFEISVMGSAGTRVEAYIREAEDLGYWAASQGMHVRTGGGNYGIMGATARGALRFMEKYPSQENKCHLSLIQMPRTLQFEGAAVDPKEIRPTGNKFMAVERDFDDRMASIFRSNINVAMAPGIGTYQEITRWLRHKRDGAPHLQNQKIILVNSAQPGAEAGIRLMDPFLKILPGHVLANDVVVVPSVDEAKGLIANLRRRPHHEPVHSTETQLTLRHS